MCDLSTAIRIYMEYCRGQKGLDAKTLKAYRIDLEQFRKCMSCGGVSDITTNSLEAYVSELHGKYKPKTAKRKIAAVKSFFHYLEYKDIIGVNPWNKVQVKYREPILLPKTIPLHTVEVFLSSMYKQRSLAGTSCQDKHILRDIAVIELLFGTGMRISELCKLRPQDIDLLDRSVLIYGKGAKERRISLGNDDVIKLLSEYQAAFQGEISECGYYFVNRLRKRLSEQSVREMIQKYSRLAGIEQHITPHMFRHSFATYLLEADVDIRYIQQMLGHSSITVTEIYTHVAIKKQKDILETKHPRKTLRVRQEEDGAGNRG